MKQRNLPTKRSIHYQAKFGFGLLFNAATSLPGADELKIVRGLSSQVCNQQPYVIAEFGQKGCLGLLTQISKRTRSFKNQSWSLFMSNSLFDYYYKA